MYKLGIDVGGTNTDAVLINSNLDVIAEVKNPTSGNMAVLGAPITLTVGIESQPYQGELSISIPAADQDRVLRVTLVVNEDEHAEYEGTLAAGSENVMLIPLSAPLAGDLECRIYLNGELFSTQTVTLR